MRQSLYSKGKRVVRVRPSGSAVPAHPGTMQPVSYPGGKSCVHVPGVDSTCPSSLFEASGPDTHPPHHQELPAFFVDASLSTLVFYAGPAPWTDAPLTRHQPGFPNEYRQIDEHWAAYVDDDDFGIGCFVPVADQLTCYRFGSEPDRPDSCSYFAPIRTLAVTPGFVFEYDVWITVGRVTDIRNRFRELAQRPVKQDPRKEDPTKEDPTKKDQ